MYRNVFGITMQNIEKIIWFVTELSPFQMAYILYF